MLTPKARPKTKTTDRASPDHVCRLAAVDPDVAAPVLYFSLSEKGLPFPLTSRSLIEWNTVGLFQHATPIKVLFFNDQKLFVLMFV